MLTVIGIAVLVALVALLWYGVRTHKTVAELKAKIAAGVADAKDAVKSKIDG